MALAPLSGSDELTFPAGAYDVRDWPVRTGVDGRRAGRVDDMLLDEGGAPRYLDVEVADGAKHVLVPIGQARVDERDDVVWIPGLDREELGAVPEYDRRAAALSPEYERRVANAFRSRQQGRRYYTRPAFRTEQLRTSGAGEFVTGRLAPLDELEDFRIAEDDPDPRGWEVIAANDRPVGRVSELIIDTDANKVRYLDCRLSATLYRHVDGSLHRLIPIGYARLDEDERRVIVDALGSAGLERLPAYTGIPIDRAFEDRLHEAFLEAYRTGAKYEHPRYSPDRFAAPRRGRAA